MGKRKRGSAYIMVVFVSFPILLAALTALAVSINSRNISARHSDFFGMYDLASAAVVSSILTFEYAYVANRQAAHRNALLYFGKITDGINNDDNDSAYDNAGDNYDNGEEEGVYLPAEYVNRFRHYLLPLIWTHFEVYFGQSGNILTRHFEINLGTDHVFYGTIRIRRGTDRIDIRSEVIKVSDNIVPMRVRVRGIVEWPDPAERKIYFCEANLIKNLDFFTPWVVELKKYDGLL